ncbi:hypothetical protein HD806DRAFT_386625 [Xylariaceae sp. AK1471]|nr:hypothetical protein HD806DRAFT_386625 [Xylariaceae sp. AK1471]
MADSPLSITASITGILTFVAAIVAFLYVRYQMLKNSNEERRTIMTSVESSVQDTNRMASTVFPGNPRVMEEFQRLTADLNSVELEIIALTIRGLPSGSQQSLYFDSQLASLVERFSIYQVAPLMVGVIRLVTGSPISWHWYRVRGKVLELMRTREALRSRQYSYILQALDIR